MGRKDVKKRGSQSARTSQGGRKSRPKESNGSPGAAALSSDASWFFVAVSMRTTSVAWKLVGSRSVKFSPLFGLVFLVPVDIELDNAQRPRTGTS